MKDPEADEQQKRPQQPRHKEEDLVSKFLERLKVRRWHYVFPVAIGSSSNVL